MAGYVYLIGSPVFGWYKIGKSITPEVRIKDLGILLPFKIHIIGVWAAQNHHSMETALHEMYDHCRINGEWFEFSKKDAFGVFSNIPAETRVYPSDIAEHPLDRFSNIVEDTKKSNKVIGVRVQKLRGDFTTEERDSRREIAISHQRIRKSLKTVSGYSKRREAFSLVCNNPYRDKRVKINTFTSLF